MTPASRRRSAIRGGVRTWIKIYLAAAVAMATAWAISWFDCSQAAATRAELEQHYTPIKELKTSSQNTKGQIDVLREREQTALALAVKRPTTALVTVVSAAARDSGGGVYVKNFDLRQSASMSGEASSQAVLQLRGLGQDDAAVAKFVENLRGGEVFTKVELKSTMAKRMNDTVVREFHVECML